MADNFRLNMRSTPSDIVGYKKATLDTSTPFSCFQTPTLGHLDPSVFTLANFATDASLALPTTIIATTIVGLFAPSPGAQPIIGEFRQQLLTRDITSGIETIVTNGTQIFALASPHACADNILGTNQATVTFPTISFNIPANSRLVFRYIWRPTLLPPIDYTIQMYVDSVNLGAGLSFADLSQATQRYGFIF